MEYKHESGTWYIVRGSITITIDENLETAAVIVRRGSTAGFVSMLLENFTKTPYKQLCNCDRSTYRMCGKRTEYGCETSDYEICLDDPVDSTQRYRIIIWRNELSKCR